MSATNYARHRTSKEYVFFGQLDVPPDSMLELAWAWYRLPNHPRAKDVLLIGESVVNRFERLGRH